MEVAARSWTPAAQMTVVRLMNENPPMSGIREEQDHQLSKRVNDQIARSQQVIEVAREVQARAASLCAESTMVVEEMRFRRSARR